jgi:Domain of unknown function (DUF1707)
VGAAGIVGRVSEELVGPEGMRVGNVEREVVVRRLNDAFSEGRLELAELDQRIAQAYAARTMAELRPLVADLPLHASRAGHGGAVPVGRPAQRYTVTRRTAAGVVRRPGWIRWQYYAWASVVTLNVVVWLLVSVGVGGLIYPWPLWVAGPWGIAILAQDVIARLEHGRR